MGFHFSNSWCYTFVTTPGNKSYSKVFKLNCVKSVIRGEGRPQDIASQNNIHPSILRNWIRMYNVNRELKDYCPKREVYMAGAKRKTTIEERKEIVEYCINQEYTK